MKNSMRSLPRFGGQSVWSSGRGRGFYRERHPGFPGQCRAVHGIVAGGRTAGRVLSGTYLRRFPEKFFAYYRRHMLYPSARPNAAHRALAQLEREGKLTAVITQNIDGLHRAAGSHNVLELHGSVLRNECLSCGREYPLSLVLETDGVPHCPACGGLSARTSCCTAKDWICTYSPE